MTEEPKASPDGVIIGAFALLFVGMVVALGAALHSCELDVTPHPAPVHVDAGSSDDAGAEDSGV